MSYIKKIILISAITTVALFSIHCIDKKGEWKVAQNVEKIQVSTRLTDLSKVKEFKAECTIKAPVQEIINVLNDVPSFPNWMANLKSARTLEKVDDNVRYDHYDADIPWPIKKRDTVMSFIWTQSEDAHVYTATITGLPELIPEVDGVIRVKMTQGFWQLTKTGEEETAIVYQMIADPGGDLPDWLINMFIVSGPHETLANLRKLVTEE